LKDECLRVLRVMSEVTRRMDLSEFARMVELKADEVLLCMQDLAKTGHLKKSGGGYGVTEKGKAVLSAQSAVSDGLGFRFYMGVGLPTGLSARSLKEFYETVKTIDAASLEFHVYRGDFASWVRSVLKDEVLAGEFESLGRGGLRGESLRGKIVAVIESRYGAEALT
jgi:hypothetical protein